MPLTLFNFFKITLAFVDLWFSKNGKNGGSVCALIHLGGGISGVGVYKGSTTLSGPFYDVWRDRIHCCILQVKGAHGLSIFS